MTRACLGCLLAVAVAAACTTVGPVSGAAVAGAAAMVAVFDQLLAAGTIDLQQWRELTDGLGEVQRQIDAAAAAAAAPQLAVEETVGIAGGTTAAMLAMFRALQRRRRRPAPSSD